MTKSKRLWVFGALGMASFAVVTACASTSTSPDADSATQSEIARPAPAAPSAPTPSGACVASDPIPQKLARLVAIMDGTKSVPDMLRALASGPAPLIPTNVTAGASQSVSLQSSKGLADPRILLYTPCYVITYSLLGSSLEFALQGAVPALPVTVDGQPKINTSDPGEVLVDFHPFPGGPAHFTVTQTVNRVGDPSEVDAGLTGNRGDTHKCSGCHVDVGSDTSTGLHLGLLAPVTVGSETVPRIIVSPLAEGSEGSGDYCVERSSKQESDLDFLYRCKCDASASKLGCSVWDEDKALSLTADACKTLQFTTGLTLSQRASFKPTACVTARAATAAGDAGADAGR